MFYDYNQNNSGGSFHYDESAGISHCVIVEADDARHADYLAERIGLYFDGSGDCQCCGDRWSSKNDSYYSDKGSESPSIYGEPIQFGVPFKTTGSYAYKWIDGYEAFVHYADGTVKGAYAS